MTGVKTISILAALVLLAAGITFAQSYPRVETFLGYTYTRANTASNVPSFSANGGGGQFAVNANKWIGFVADIGAVHNGNIGGNQLDTTLTNFMFGPRVSLRYSRIRPYFNVLFGGVYGSTSIPLNAVPVATPYTVPGVTPTPGEPVTLRVSASQTAFAMTSGGGLDIKISHHVSFRPIGLDYFMTRLQNLRSANDNNQHHIRYTTGFNFTFGGEEPAPPPPPPPPAMKGCPDGSQVAVDAECPKMNMNVQWSSAQASLCAGGSLHLAPTGFPENAGFQWTINDEPISQGPTLDFGTEGREPGTYRVGLKVTAPNFTDVTRETTIAVRGYKPPVLNVEVVPHEVKAGDKAAVTVNVTPGECGGTAGAPVLTASEGSISGGQFDSSEVRFDPASGDQRKNVTIEAKVVDEKGSATASATVTVTRQVVARRFQDIVFPAGSARVNNCGKRLLLEELKAVIEGDPTGKVVLVGHTSSAETAKPGLDEARALNAAAVLSAGSGVCYHFPAAQILIGAVAEADNGVDYQSYFCGSTQERPGSAVKESDASARERRVEIWFVPAGAALPASLKDYKEAASLPLSGLGCPR